MAAAFGVIRVAGALGLFLALSACMPGGQGPGAGGGTAAGPNPVTGGEIEVTELAPLPAAAAAAAPSAAAPSAAAPSSAPPAAAAPPAARPSADTPRPRPRPAAAGEAAPETPGQAEAPGQAGAAEAPVPADPVPEAAKSEAQLACERRRGVWADAGNGLNACVQTTRDAGKTCRKAGDCEGECLARSGTCAPFTPLFGCNDIFDDAGRRMTLCLD